MKTPREILFERHRNAEPKLDELRQRVVAAVSPAAKADEVRARELGGAPTCSRLSTSGGHREPVVSQDVRSRLQVGGPGLLRKVWLELIWPSRRAWAGLAAVWLALLAVNVEMNSAPKAVRPGGRTVATREMVQAFREQRRVLVELLPAAEPPPVQVPRPGFRQRSDRASVFKEC